MSKKNFFISILTIAVMAIAVLGAWSCKKSTTAGCSVAWSTELNDEIMALSNASQAYSLDPTYDNCLAYKAAAQAYVDALAPYGNCATLTGTDKAAWQQALDDAQEGVDDIDCQP